MQKCWVWLKVGQTIKHVVNMTFQIDNGGGVNSHFRGEDHTHTHTHKHKHKCHAMEDP